METETETETGTETETETGTGTGTATMTRTGKGTTRRCHLIRRDNHLENPSTMNTLWPHDH